MTSRGHRRTSVIETWRKFSDTMVPDLLLIVGIAAAALIGLGVLNPFSIPCVGGIFSLSGFLYRQRSRLR